jgi:hypothetical protein
MHAEAISVVSFKARAANKMVAREEEEEKEEPTLPRRCCCRVYRYSKQEQ